MATGGGFSFGGFGAQKTTATTGNGVIIKNIV